MQLIETLPKIKGIDQARIHLSQDAAGRKKLLKELSKMHELANRRVRIDSMDPFLGDHEMAGRTRQIFLKIFTRTGKLNPKLLNQDIDSLIRTALLPIQTIDDVKEDLQCLKSKQADVKKISGFLREFNRQLAKIKDAILNLLQNAYGYPEGYLKGIFANQNKWDAWVSLEERITGELKCTVLQPLIDEYGWRYFEGSRILFLGAGIGEDMASMAEFLESNRCSMPIWMAAIEKETKYAEALRMRGYNLACDTPIDMLTTRWESEFDRVFDFVIFNFPPEMNAKEQAILTEKVRKVLRKNGKYLQFGTEGECYAKLGEVHQIDKDNAYIAVNIHGRERSDPGRVRFVE